jgi:hypothetical protein
MLIPTPYAIAPARLVNQSAQGTLGALILSAFAEAVCPGKLHGPACSKGTRPRGLKPYHGGVIVLRVRFDRYARPV